MTSSNRLSYITGLDGIRAVAVMAVLFYHANFPWALGGFLGVETFFVLSGFLITLLLLAEWQATNEINLNIFGCGAPAGCSRRCGFCCWHCPRWPSCLRGMPCLAYKRIFRLPYSI